jgi:hypothetical protein
VGFLNWGDGSKIDAKIRQSKFFERGYWVKGFFLLPDTERVQEKS